MARCAMATALVRVAACVVGVAVWAGAARAEAPDREASLRQARQHFINGKKAFEAKRYPAALAEFQAGYDLEPRRGFLLDMGHAARKMGDLPRARELYQRFLQTDPPDAERRMAQQFAREIDRKLAQTAPAPAKPAPPDDEAEASPVASEPAESHDAELTLVSPTLEPLTPEPLLLAPVPEPDEPSQSDRSGSTRWWLWAGLGVLVAGAAATVLILRARDTGDDAHSSGSWGQVKL